MPGGHVPTHGAGLMVRLLGAGPQAGDVRLQGRALRARPSYKGWEPPLWPPKAAITAVPSGQAYSAVWDDRTAPKAPSVPLGEWWGGVGVHPHTGGRAGLGVLARMAGQNRGWRTGSGRSVRTGL